MTICVVSWNYSRSTTVCSVFLFGYGAACQIKSAQEIRTRNQKDHLAPISAARKDFFFFGAAINKTVVSPGEAVISTASLSNTGQRYIGNNVCVSRINVFISLIGLGALILS